MGVEPQKGRPTQHKREERELQLGDRVTHPDGWEGPIDAFVKGDHGQDQAVILYGGAQVALNLSELTLATRSDRRRSRGQNEHSNIRSDIHHGVSATPSEESHIPPELDAETVNELNNELLAVFRESDLGDGEATSDSPDPGEVTTPNPDEEDLSSVSVSELAQRMRDAIATQRKFGQNGTSKPINQQEWSRSPSARKSKGRTAPMRSIDLHGKHVHQVEPILQQEIFQAMKQEAEALEIVHGWKDGDSLLKEVARVMQQMKTDGVITDWKYAPPAGSDSTTTNPGATLAIL